MCLFVMIPQNKVEGSKGINFSEVMFNELPEGLSNVDTLFHKAEIPNSSNSFNYVNSTKYQNDKPNTQIAVITKVGEIDKLGASWSDENGSTSNYVDITKNQTMSMWLYFGGGTETGNGMAFVLQNDGINAFATKDGTTGVGGQSMGVWGGVNLTESPLATPSTLAKRAIQNSWALEFDTFADLGSAKDSNFDYDINKKYRNINNHIASGYPADPNMYKSDSNGPILNHEYFDSDIVSTTNRNGRLLTDDNWHHLTVTWNKAEDGQKPSITYNYDDKNMDGTPDQYEISRTIPIDVSKFNLQPGDNKLIWGFTGSTGQQSENNLVAFESIPSLVEASAKATIYDNDQGQNISENGIVHNGDNLTVNYDLQHESGTQAWKSVATDITLPTNINYDTGSAVITYDDNSTETVDISKVSSNKITQTLKKDINQGGPKAVKISISGKATAGSSAVTTVATTHSRFKGTNLIKDTQTPSFIIKQPKPINLKNTYDLNRTISSNENPEIGGQAAYTTSDLLDTTSAKFHISVNNQTGVAYNMSDYNHDVADTIKFMIPADELKQGDNTVSIYVTDAEMNKSNVITYNIKVTGSLQVTAAKLSSFQSIQSLSPKEYIHRANDWLLSLKDTRSQGSTWVLEAQADPLKNANGSWNGSMVFIDKDGNEKSFDNNNIVKIAAGTKDGDASDSFDISSEWGKDSGVLLKQASLNAKGVYSTTVNWTAVDSMS